jgi:TonB family protein
MAPAVDQVLAERERLARSGPAAASLIAAALLHAAVVALVVVLPRLTPPRPPLEYVAVQVVPAQRLGAEHPAPQAPPAPRPPAPAPQTTEEPPAPPRSPEAPVLPRQQPPPAQKPSKPEKPKPAPPDNRVDPTTLPKVLPPPREALQKRLGPAAAAPPEPRPGAPGTSTGAATGKAPVGSLTVTLENQDFTYNYYIAQTQSRIEQNWTRSPVGNNVRAVVSFRIHTDGGISDLTLAESSGFDTFDLAALRAVQNAAPFPPLPRAYTLSHEFVSVNWIAR